MEDENVRDVKIFINMKYEKRYINKNYVAEVNGTFNDIFGKDIKVKVEDVDIKQKGDKDE
jgi:hypothetical protein